MKDSSPSTRDKILDAAEGLFARKGLSGIGLREVADAVGISKSTLFHHFETKLHLYQEVLERVLERIARAVTPCLNSPADAAEKLSLWLEALIDALADHPATARLLLRSLFEDEDELPRDDDGVEAVEHAIAEILGGFQRLLVEGIETGRFRRVSVEDVTQTMIGATVYHFASGEIGTALMGAPLFSAESVRRRKREVTDFLRRGIEIGPATAGSGERAGS